VGGGDGTARAVSERLRELPSVERLAAALDAPHALAVAAARAAVDEARAALLSGGEPAAAFDALLSRARALLAASERPSLRRVVNATGVIVHTNLGRAPLPAAAREAVARVAEGSSNLELDLGSGARGSRQAHVEGLLRELTGAEAGLVVNNGAAAALLAVAALAGRGRPVVVSRGELVEIGGGFRIPEVVAQSGARLVEVGTTNRTRLADYRAALAEHEDAVVLRVHASNFRVLGFTERVEVEELCDLGAPVVDDVGSGNLAEALPVLAEEPAVRRSVRAGAALVCFSGDKLLGGPQAGLLVGTEAAVASARRHPLARALRIDKLSLAALEATLRLYRDPARARREVPVLAMLEASEDELAARAARLQGTLAAAGVAATVERAVAKVGGGALPLLELAGPVVTVDPSPLPADELARRLRDARELRAAPAIAVVTRIERERLVLDPRTMTDDDAEVAGAQIVAALR
jgi:L-seryl-tRNA(Ser) seleniumtransferase